MEPAPMEEMFSKSQSQWGGSGINSTRNKLPDTSTIDLNAESSSLQKFYVCEFDVATLASKLATGGSPDSFIVREKLLDKVEDDEEKVRGLERHRELKKCQWYLKYSYSSCITDVSR